MRLPAHLIGLVLLLGAHPAAGQCPDPFYRWTEKTRESLASLTPVKQSIRTIIASWDTLDSGMIAEIPPAELAANYDQARTDLKNRVMWDSNGDVAQPVRLRFIGAAFFDGEHRGGATRRNETDTNHGRCNSSARALWELHPVYWV